MGKCAQFIGGKITMKDKINEVQTVIRASFWTLADTLYKTGEYKTMLAFRRARDRYEMEYGGCLRAKYTIGVK